MTEIIVAVIGFLGLLLVALINRAGNKKVLSKIQTNGGIEPYQYLEKIAEVQSDVALLRGELKASTQVLHGHLYGIKVDVGALQGRVSSLELSARTNGA
jgi:hypothetical protein